MTVEPEFDGRPLSTTGFKGSMEKPIPLTRCESMTRASGGSERCKRWALMGSTRCPKHLGFGHLASVQEARQRVIERGRARLVLGSEDAIDTLLELVKDGPAAVRLKAATEVLDRVGISPKTEVDVNVTHHVGDSADVVRERLERIRSRSIDGEVVRGSTTEPLELTVNADGSYSAPAGGEAATTAATVLSSLSDIPLATLDSLKYRRDDRVLVSTKPEWGICRVLKGPSDTGYFYVISEAVTTAKPRWCSGRSLRDLPSS
jgi:hypothetical protein